MAARITGPYRGFYINATATLSGHPHPTYVGSISLTEHGVDEPRKLERLLPLGAASAFADEEVALGHLEEVARGVIDALFQDTGAAPSTKM
ncbi:hypothetical protein WM40_25165 [Robbsia andropogonis]|uniref:Uncharacterized protein n=1 Tax=Robbsia andropogonis TaxID=28092 RepID=A0A0F5JTX6_9BURK|nr:hypothetical protein [Robbsia andropogonis]KKB61095.1 hypothetical protein WM40_25165 [Robbsia andropogonis]MCP1120969.1 hypothetical protein [Robbsia andropogonis]MCP1130750.1 hypothetical protein [Robbsia andropogonis]